MRIGSLLSSATWSLNLKKKKVWICDKQKCSNCNCKKNTGKGGCIWGKCNVTVWPLGVGPSLQTSQTRCEGRPSPSPSEWRPSDHHGPDPPDAHRRATLIAYFTLNINTEPKSWTQTSHYHSITSVTGQNDDVDRWGVIGHTDSSIFGFILTWRVKKWSGW